MILKLLKYLPRITAAVILLQTLFFKFGIGGPEALKESQILFSKLSEGIFGNINYEAYFRIPTGLFELIASVLILIPKTSVYGAILSIGLMSGAVLSHIFFLGISHNEDGGSLFMLAIIVLLCGSLVAWQEKEKIKNLW